MNRLDVTTRSDYPFQEHQQVWQKSCEGIKMAAAASSRKKIMSGLILRPNNPDRIIRMQKSWSNNPDQMRPEGFPKRYGNHIALMEFWLKFFWLLLIGFDWFFGRSMQLSGAMIFSRYIMGVPFGLCDIQGRTLKQTGMRCANQRWTFVLISFFLSVNRFIHRMQVSFFPLLTALRKAVIDFRPI